MNGNFPVVLNFTWLFLKLNRFICRQLPVFPDHCSSQLGPDSIMSSYMSWSLALLTYGGHVVQAGHSQVRIKKN